MAGTRREFLGVAVGCAAARAAGRVGWTRAEQERFLKEAEVDLIGETLAGVTGSRRIVLKDGRTRHAAHWQTVHRYLAATPTPSGVARNVLDSYRHNVAAYRLDRMLGLEMVPVAVVREIEGVPSALTWCVDDVWLTKLERKRRNRFPPDQKQWLEEDYIRRVFDQLIANTDRNQSNILITRDWRMWFIDHTRAFMREESLISQRDLVRCDERLWKGLAGLNEQVLAAEMDGLLDTACQRALLGRRDRIVEEFNVKARKVGPNRVFYEFLGSRKGRFSGAA